MHNGNDGVTPTHARYEITPEMMTEAAQKVGFDPVPGRLTRLAGVLNAMLAVGVQPVEAPSFRVGDVVRYFHHVGLYDEAVVLEASPTGSLTVRDVKTGTIYGWSSRMVQLAPAAGVSVVDHQTFRTSDADEGKAKP